MNTKMKRKPMSDKQYRDSDGTKCPYCGSENISGKHVEVDAGGATQEIGCTDCGKSWYDCYSLTGYIPKETP